MKASKLKASKLKTSKLKASKLKASKLELGSFKAGSFKAGSSSTFQFSLKVEILTATISPSVHATALNTVACPASRRRTGAALEAPSAFPLPIPGLEAWHFEF